MYSITKKFTFDAAHQLEGLDPSHKCGRLHGHTYTVEVTIGSESLTEEGWVIDFGDLSWIKDFIDNELDHRNLNVFMKQPTSENLAKYFFGAVLTWLVNRNYPHRPWIDCVRVSETPNTSAVYFETYAGE
jgi:6-pyruvoyltetrahydropterin/6-carboxytetrahydropterin synthase